MPSFIDKTLNKILYDQLERRFGKLLTKSTTQTTTKMDITRSSKVQTTPSPKMEKPKKCGFKTFDDCTLKEWTKFMNHAMKHHKHRKITSVILH